MLGISTEVLRKSREELEKIKGTRITKTIGFFDLTGSTQIKLDRGHTLGRRAALLHNLICRKIVTKHKGSVVKEFGDGLLVDFEDPVSACLAAMEIKNTIHKTGKIFTKAGLTIGALEEIEISGTRDLLGATVDRCARIQGAAMSGQILIDAALHDTVYSFLKDHQNIRIAAPRTIKLKGIGNIVTYELSTKDMGFVSCRRIPFTISEKGRLLISEKVAFMQNAKSEIVELGTALNTFTGYFRTRRSAEFKDHIVKLLGEGVTLKCVLLDPDCGVAREYAKDRMEKDLLEKIRVSIKRLKEQQKEFMRLKLTGTFEIYLYRHFPYFHAVCIDPDTKEGQMTVSPYIFGTRRANTPVFQFCRALNGEIFSKYWYSIKNLLSESRKL